MNDRTMYLFNQNDEMSYSKRNELLMAENFFINKEISERALPTFEQAISKLPQPICDEHEDYMKSYWRAWEIAFRRRV